MKRKRKKNKRTPRLLPSVVVDYWRCNEELPGLWDDMSHLAGAKADGEIWWPDYCPIPCAAGYTALYTRSNADPKAHIRRAHWHHYWVGSERRGDRHLELRWIPPVQVGGATPAPKVINIKEGKHGAS